jgi:aminoglycoside 2''-phosphotransferase
MPRFVAISSVEGARAVLRAAFPEFDSSRLTAIERGWDHFVIEVDEQWIFRFPRRPDSEYSLEREIRVLNKLSSHLPTAVPRYEKIARPGPGHPHLFAGYRKLGGQALEWRSLDARARERFASDLGGFLRALHAIPPGPVQDEGVPGGSPQHWWAEYRGTYRRVRTQILPLLDEVSRERILRLWARFLESDRFQFEPVVQHRDLSGEHVLVDRESGRLRGVIDWGDCAVGDPAFDFTGFTPISLGERDAGAFVHDLIERVGVPVDEHFFARLDFYARISPIYGVLLGLDEDDRRRRDGSLNELVRRLELRSDPSEG